MLNKILSFSLVAMLIASCEQNEATPEISPDYIVFGHFYGFCVGEQCIEIFKLTDNELYEDTSDAYPRWDRYDEGKWVKLDQDKFEKVRSLADHIPPQLISAEETIFGSPDATDGGGIYFAIISNEETKYWLIDQMEQNIPAYLRPFKEQINTSISMISD